MDNLAKTYQMQGRMAEAQAQFTQAIEGYRRVVGDHHFLTLAEQSAPPAEFYLDESRPKAEPLLAHVWGDEARTGWSRAKMPIFRGFTQGVTARRPEKCSDNSIRAIPLSSLNIGLIIQISS